MSNQTRPTSATSPPGIAAATQLGTLVQHMVDRGISRLHARAFALHALWEAMPAPAPHAPFQSPVKREELTPGERKLLNGVLALPLHLQDPAIFGEVFQSSMEPTLRHAKGAHYTRTEDILKVLHPTLIQPWEHKISKAGSPADLNRLHQELCDLTILDPACGSGNFLVVAYRTLHKLQDAIAEKHQQAGAALSSNHRIHLRQCAGFDTDKEALALAQLCLQLEQSVHLGTAGTVPTQHPRLVCADALFCEWPNADIIIGNPPFQSKNKRQAVMGSAYGNQLRQAFPDVPGRADYCVYFFRKAHDALKPGQRAGLVGTNTIRQNYSRQGGLDYIVNHGGTIFDAVSTQRWSGDAVVHVSIVNWIRGTLPGPFPLRWQEVSGKWKQTELARISSALSPKADVTTARILPENRLPKKCYQGQTQGHAGFLVPSEKGETWLQARQERHRVLKPFLTGEDMLRTFPVRPSRFIIDFQGLSLEQAQSYPELFHHIQSTVRPTRVAAAAKETARNQHALANNPKARLNRHHQNFLRSWWQLSYARTELIASLKKLPRYIVCSRVTKYPLFCFVPSRFRPSDSLTVFAFEDLYAFGVLQSRFHCDWFRARCSTLGTGWRYTSNTVYDTFPWPDPVSHIQRNKVEEATASLLQVREAVHQHLGVGLRKLYAQHQKTPIPALTDAHAALDASVAAAYGKESSHEPLAFLLALNQERAVR